MGAGPHEEGREGEAEDASSSRHQGEERRGQTETTLSPQPTTKVSDILIGFRLIVLFSRNV